MENLQDDGALLNLTRRSGRIIALTGGLFHVHSSRYTPKASSPFIIPGYHFLNNFAQGE
jgi:hypothetical protein